MGTHMWTNGSSRRGKRMTVEFGNHPPIPMNPGDAELLKQRPDLFYPYMPAAFLNGIQQKINPYFGNHRVSHEP